MSVSEGFKLDIYIIIIIIFCLNHCVDPTLADGSKSPLQVAKFLMTDISPLMYFYFWEPEYFLMDEK
jgi:hypothetical protein